jgi:hypothetical protein
MALVKIKKNAISIIARLFQNAEFSERDCATRQR